MESMLFTNPENTMIITQYRGKLTDSSDSHKKHSQFLKRKSLHTYFTLFEIFFFINNRKNKHFLCFIHITLFHFIRYPFYIYKYMHIC